MNCRMNVYNGNTWADNGFETASTFGNDSDGYQTLFQLTPVAVQTSGRIVNEIEFNNFNNDENRCCCRRCHCCRRRCCRCCRD